MSTRKRDTFTDINDDDLDYDLENMPMTDSCDTVRRKIRALIDSGEMDVGEFQKVINTSSKVYSSFMMQNGPYKGSGSSVYYNAWAFFKKRELRGVKTAKKLKTTATAGPKESEVNIVNGVLEGEALQDAEVYGTNSYLWWLLCAWGGLALATDAVWDFSFD